MTAPRRPVLRYHGGKWRLGPWVMQHFPPHRVYVEPFGGAASVLMQKPRVYAEVYNELDGEVVNVFRVLQDPASAARLHELVHLLDDRRDQCARRWRAAPAGVSLALAANGGGGARRPPPRSGKLTTRLELCPVTIGEARVFVQRHHRHHRAPQSGLFALAVSAQRPDPIGVVATLSFVVGVAVVGRPVARHYQDGYTAEVTRCCVLDEHRNACSMLYGAAWRAAKALGYRRLITYTLKSESGASLRGAGWRVIAERDARSWREDSPGRPRVDKTPPAQRLLWEVTA